MSGTGLIKRRGLSFFLVLLVALALSLRPAPIARAATIAVNSTADTAADDGLCTLREAIVAANTDTASGSAAGECAAGSGDDTIDLTGVAGTIDLSGPLPDVASNVALHGPGAGSLTVRRDSGGDYRILTVDAAATVVVSGLTVSNGSVADAFGGGIYNAGTLTLDDVHVHDHHTAGNDSSGGGIYNAGTLTLNNSTVSDNSTSTTYAFSNGGGIYNVGALALNNSTVSGNNTSSTGAYNNGGGIYNAGSGSSVTLESSTVSGNRSNGGGSGGGIWNSEGASVTLTNSTVSGNISSDNGGGINNTSSSTLTLNNSTISDNTANESGGGIWNDLNSTVRLKNSILAANVASVAGPDCQNTATFISADYNLVGDDSSCPFTPQAHDRVDVDPLLGPLQDNGGATQTHALGIGSPAIDAIPEASCTDHQGTPIAADQRGIPRPQGPACDIGAYEEQVALVVTKTDDTDDGRCDADCSLREAIIAANAALRHDTIIVPTGTYTLTIAGRDEDAAATGDLDITDDLTITGAGAMNTIVDGGGVDRVFHITGTITVQVSGATIQGGQSYGDGGGILNDGGTVILSNVVISDNLWSGIENHDGGTVKLTNSTVSHNVGSFGGGICNDGIVELIDSAVNDNSAHTACGGIENSGGTVMLINSTVSHNVAGEGYGGICSNGTLTLTNSVVSDNSPGGISGSGAMILIRSVVSRNEGIHDGGITIFGGTAVLTGSAVISNSLTTLSEGAHGGGISIYGGTVALNGTVVRNNATRTDIVLGGHGGGIYNAGVLTLNESSVISNSVTTTANDSYGGGIYNAGTLTLTHSVVSDNNTYGHHCHGGGIHNGGTLVVRDSTVSGNSASTGSAGDGGGIHNVGSSSQVLLINSTVSGNRSNGDGSGGGIWNSEGAEVVLTNSTVSGNTSSWNGGGINNTSGAALTLNNSTVSANRAGRSGGGIWNDRDGMVALKNSILARNTARSGPDCWNTATFASADYNLVGDDSSCPFAPQAHDQVDVDPLLGPLQDNGGATETHALAFGSPAVDAIPEASCTDHQGTPIIADQRGVSRPQELACDIGAYELEQFYLYLPLVVRIYP